MKCISFIASYFDALSERYRFDKKKKMSTIRREETLQLSFPTEQ